MKNTLMLKNTTQYQVTVNISNNDEGKFFKLI